MLLVRESSARTAATGRNVRPPGGHPFPGRRWDPARRVDRDEHVAARRQLVTEPLLAALVDLGCGDQAVTGRAGLLELAGSRAADPAQADLRDALDLRQLADPARRAGSVRSARRRPRCESMVTTSKVPWSASARARIGAIVSSPPITSGTTAWPTIFPSASFARRAFSSPAPNSNGTSPTSTSVARPCEGTGAPGRSRDGLGPRRTAGSLPELPREPLPGLAARRRRRTRRRARSPVRRPQPRAGRGRRRPDSPRNGRS
jgi:hypothetical protein